MSKASTRVLRVLFLCGLASVGLYGGASCSSGKDTGGTSSASGTGGASADVVVYEGDANDEALEALEAVEGPANPSTYAVFDEPKEGVVLPSSPAPTFKWHLKMPSDADAGTDSGAFLLRPALPERRALLGPLLELFGKERTAEAHGTPLTGLGYLLLFTSEKNNDLLRVFTSKTTYTPGPGAMEILQAVDGPIQAWILTGVFDNNVLTADGGPFRGPWISFELAK
ncbi:MAG: hypothetical protein ACMG6S_03310 [Byssovorax sp.]